MSIQVRFRITRFGQITLGNHPLAPPEQKERQAPEEPAIYREPGETAGEKFEIDFSRGPANYRDVPSTA